MCTPVLCTYTTVLSAYVHALDMDGPDKFFRWLNQGGHSPDEVTHGDKANDLEKMMARMWRNAAGTRGNPTVLITIMDAYGKKQGLRQYRDLVLGDGTFRVTSW